MFTARNPRWWLRAAGAVGVVALTAALLASASAGRGRPRSGPGDGGADPRLDAAALAIAVVVSTAVLLLLRRPVTDEATDDGEVTR
ncbi:MULTISPECIES: hypothetical protein [Streptomyces]|uniref:hypothetical protein n=1 Tax=Streptomyces TaxID=1883 RepID=UPI000F657474|nr:hypothetical protein [Streptomyces alboflavus]